MRTRSESAKNRQNFSVLAFAIALLSQMAVAEQDASLVLELPSIAQEPLEQDFAADELVFDSIDAAQLTAQAEWDLEPANIMSPVAFESDLDLPPLPNDSETTTTTITNTETARPQSTSYTNTNPENYQGVTNEMSSLPTDPYTTPTLDGDSGSGAAFIGLAGLALGFGGLAIGGGSASGSSDGVAPVTTVASTPSATGDGTGDGSGDGDNNTVPDLPTISRVFYQIDEIAQSSGSFSIIIEDRYVANIPLQIFVDDFTNFTQATHYYNTTPDSFSGFDINKLWSIANDGDASFDPPFHTFVQDASMGSIEFVDTLDAGEPVKTISDLELIKTTTTTPLNTALVNSEWSLSFFLNGNSNVLSISDVLSELNLVSVSPFTADGIVYTSVYETNTSFGSQLSFPNQDLSAVGFSSDAMVAITFDVSFTGTAVELPEIVGTSGDDMISITADAVVDGNNGSDTFVIEAPLFGAPPEMVFIARFNQEGTDQIDISSFFSGINFGDRGFTDFADFLANQAVSDGDLILDFSQFSYGAFDDDTPTIVLLGVTTIDETDFITV